MTAIYPYIRAENSSTGCTSICIHHGFCKMLWHCSPDNYESNNKKNNNIFTGLNFFFKALNFRFWQVSQIFDLESKYFPDYLRVLKLYNLHLSNLTIITIPCLYSTLFIPYIRSKVLYISNSFMYKTHMFETWYLKPISFISIQWHYT